MLQQGAQGALNGAGTTYPINGHAIVQPAPAMQAVGTLAAMKTAPRWLVRRGKVPSYASGAPRAAGGYLDTDEDRAQLVTHAEAVAAIDGPLAGRGYALGFALGPDGRGGCWQGIDLDDVEANGLVDLANSLPGYVEYSPSGKGAHAIGYGSEFSTMTKVNGVEAYSTGRFFTFTGHAVKDAALCDLAPFVSAQLLPLRKPLPAAASPVDSSSCIVIDAKTKADIESALTYCDPNSHKSWIDQGQRLKKLGEPGRELWFRWAEGSPKFNYWENVSVWNSFDGSKTSHVAIFKEAQANGWSNPGHVLDVPLINISALDRQWEQRRAGPTNVVAIDQSRGESGAQLMLRQMQPIAYLSEPFLAEGLTLVAGRPKLGKTTLLRQLAVGISTGGAFLDGRCQQASVLFLCLEEGDRLNKLKLERGRYSQQEVAAIFFVYTWQRGRLGALALSEYLTKFPDVRLVVIDSLSRFRAVVDGKTPAFQADYEAVTELQEIAKRHAGVAIVVIHHTRKMKSEDPIDDISGTYGLTAACDTYMVMRHHAQGAALHVGGRLWDRDETEFGLTKGDQRWHLQPAFDGMRSTQVDAMQIIRQHGSVTPTELARELSITPPSAHERLQALVKAGQVKSERGRYVAAYLTKPLSP